MSLIWQKKDQKYLTGHYTNGHGNVLGYREYGAEIGTYVDWMINKSPTLFGYVQFINTPYANINP